MIIYNLAMQIESNGEEYYLEQAEKTEDRVLKEVFKILADDERRHYQIIETIKAEVPMYIYSDSLDKLSHVFRTREMFIDTSKIKNHELDSYKEVLENEQDCIYLYKRAAEECDDEHIKDIFLKLMEEEEKHAVIMENIAEIMNRPLDLVESTEFNILERFAV